MKDHIFTLSKNDLKDLVKTYRIPLDLHPRLPDLGFTMDRLPVDAIGIWSKAILDYQTWRHSCSCVSDDLPSDGYDRNDVQRLCARLIYLREIREERWASNFMNLSSWSDAKIVDESHHLSLLLLERVPSHTTSPTSEVKGSFSGQPTIEKEEAAEKSFEMVLVLRSWIWPKDRLERDEGVSMRVVSAHTLRLGKRLGAPPSIDVTSVSDPSHVRTSTPASTSGRSLSLGGAVAGGHVKKSKAQMGEVMRHQMDPLNYLAWSALACDAEYDQILDDDFDIATRGVSSLMYTREDWNGRHAPESNILCKDIFKDPNVCRKALDRTITSTELKRTESLLPLEFSIHVNVLSALLVSHGYELNSSYANLVSSKAHLQEKFDKKKGDVMLLRSEVTSLDRAASEEVRKLQSQLTNAKTTSTGLSEELTQTDVKISEQALTSLVRKLLSSDEFHAALAHVVSLGINYAVERGLRIGRTNVEFKAAVQKVSNFHVGAKADFDKALDDFPTTPFPFLSKIVATSECGLPDVAQILSDKFAHSATSVTVASSSASEALKQVSP
nr:hypothetical protein [Tanacetum cinerariifolium]